LLKWPAGHRVQLLLAAREYFPAKQSVQNWAPPLVKVPAGQDESQEDAPTELK
jgi:hypothetical protein